MKDETSIFGAKPERLDRLVFEALQDSEAEDAAQTASLGAVLERPGGQIGRYKLLSILGEGGMGVVYLAEQEEPIRRRLALKVIKPGMDSKRIIARFEAERQALALLDHPNIAHVYDADTTETARPYFVMEYVKGLPITEYCDHHKLTIEDRLNLFRQVCLAVHHAHQKGIIHRDIKPSNILVSLQDDQAIPKIIDFGVAKALAQPLTERTLATEDSQLLGTPEYMSPEQADMAGEDIDTRSDVYSLGVLLYVLLTGVLPFDPDTLREGGIDNIRQILRETDPKTPSTRLTKLGEEGKKLAENRRTEIHTLAKHLKKELEWIPLKAMRKDRSERYRSASELADDIGNYLKGAPLIAGPESTVYLIRKFVKRKRALVSGIAAVLVVLFAGIIVSTVLAIRQARALADTRLVVDFLTNDVLGSAAEARAGEVVSAGYLLDAGSKTIGEKFRDRPLLEAEIHKTLAGTYRRLNELKQAEQHALRAIEIYQKNLGEAHPDTLKVMSFIGWIYIKQGRYRDMEQLYTKLVQIRRDVHGIEHQVGDLHGLAVASYALGKYKQAELLFDEMLQTYQSETPFVVHIKANLANVYRLQGRYEEAERLFDETFVDDQLGYANCRALVYQAQGRYEKAEQLLVQALETLRMDRGDEHFDTLECMFALVCLYVDQDRYDEAQALFNEALPIARKLFRKEHPLTLSFVNAYAVLHTKQKQYNEAEKLFDEALKGRQRELGDDHPHTLESKNDLAVLYKEQGRFEEAEPLLLEAVEGRRLKLGDTHPHTQQSLNNLIELYEAWNEPEKAAEWRTKLPEEN
jgi:non-specific serine/threonine protein kinase/serine/threonine-protein kinase